MTADVRPAGALQDTVAAAGSSIVEVVISGEVCVELACLALAGGGTRELGVRITEYVSPRCRSRSLWEAP